MFKNSVLFGKNVVELTVLLGATVVPVSFGVAKIVVFILNVPVERINSVINEFCVFFIPSTFLFDLGLTTASPSLKIQSYGVQVLL